MIIKFILDFIAEVLKFFLYPLTLLPDATLPQGLIDATVTAGGYLKGFDTMIPLSTIFAILGASLVIEGGIFLYKKIMWSIKRIHK